MDKKRKILKIIHKLQNSYPDHAVPHEDIVKKCDFDPSPTLLWLHAEDYISRYNTAGTITYNMCPKGEDCLSSTSVFSSEFLLRNVFLPILISLITTVIARLIEYLL